MRKPLAILTSVMMAAAMLIAAFCAPAAAAQGTNAPAIVYAEQFNNWSIASQSANTYTFTGAPCWSQPIPGLPGYFIFGPTSTPYPVLIRDANPSNSEVVTPSSTSQTQSSCGFSASPANSHTSFTVSSGTAGLQDAVGIFSASGGAAVVGIDKTYYALVAGLPGSKTVGGIISTLKGSTGVQVVDTTTSPWTYYAWNGSQYFANGGGTPTIAAGAGLGTSPTGLTVSGNGAQGVISVTAGTSTATGTLFTLTFHSGTTADGFNHSPTCTIASVGANTPAGTLAAGSVGGSVSAGYQQPFTIATTALTASTFYSFSYSCK